MDAGTGRHRRRDLRRLATAGILIAPGSGFLVGMATSRYLSGGADDGPAASPPSSTSALSSVPATGSASPPEQPSEATGSAAPADPAPPGPRGARAYLARSADDGLPVERHRDVLLVLGRVVCEAPPSEQADDEAAPDRVAAVAGDLLPRERAQLAAQELCAA